MNHDDATFEEVKRVLANADPAPDDVIAAAKESFTWRTVDAELAELVFDSAVDELAGVRGATTAERQLMFRAGDVEIEVLVEGNTITGQLVPPQEAAVELVAGGVASHAEVDEFGAFTFDDVPAGPVRLTVRVGDQAIATEWTVL